VIRPVPDPQGLRSTLARYIARSSIDDAFQSIQESYNWYSEPDPYEWITPAICELAKHCENLSSCIENLPKLAWKALSPPFEWPTKANSSQDAQIGGSLEQRLAAALRPIGQAMAEQSIAWREHRVDLIAQLNQLSDRCDGYIEVMTRPRTGRPREERRDNLIFQIAEVYEGSQKRKRGQLGRDSFVIDVAMALRVVVPEDVGRLVRAIKKRRE
jgi:hypothetical protein